ncbi:hypothetical protein [Maricaulis maris]|uniref:Uncharacterized protein n=1 Tax=Maricaulis maris TaxID=74318 RepID=A0A495CY11_9PROT|nr:hypothetical protein [Maricaulis maris]RKQ94134.1 hypothetical protein C7435_3106 [Maricaulis maris]
MSGRVFGESVADLIAWAVEEVRRDLPRPVAHLGRRVVADRYELSPQGRLSPTGQVLRSWLGVLSRTDNTTAARGGRADGVELALSEAAVFRTQADVNPVIARRGDAALRARLQQHSPLPPEQAVLAYSLAGLGRDGRIVVDVAVAHRAAVETARHLARERAARWQVVADRSQGAPLVFADSKAGEKRSLWRNVVLRSLIIAAAALVCLSAVSHRFEREADHIVAQRDRLLEEVRHLRLQRAAQDDIEPALLFARSHTGLPDLLDGLADVMAHPDMPAAVARIDLQSPDAVRILPTESGLGSLSIALDVSPTEESGS